MPTTAKTANLNQPTLAALVANYNKLNTALASQGLLPHHDQRLVTDTGTADLNAVIALANAIKTAWNLHVADTGAHVAADATNPTAVANASDQATANALLNDLKTKFNAHIAVAASHRPLLGEGVATQSTIATANAIDLATSKALAAALLLAVNRHMGAGAPQIVLQNA